MNRIGVIIIGLMFSSICMALDLSMPSIFADQMVLQRGQDVPVWGTADAGATVEVLFAGQSETVEVGIDGNWRIDLKPLVASAESRIMTITAKLNREIVEIEISDVLVGEVWIAGGQSNMYRPFRMLVGKAAEAKYEPVAEYLREESATANDSLFRQYRVGREHSILEEKSEGRGSWSKAVSGDVNEFCGTAYFFGRELRRELNVPVAILSCNLGATKVEPWIPMSAYENNETLKEYYKNEIITYEKELASWDEVKEKEAYRKLIADWEIRAEEAKLQGENEPRKPRKPEHPNRNKQIPATLYNAMIHPMVPYAVKGAIWYQGESNSGNLPEQYGMRLTSMIEGWRTAWDQKDFFFNYCQLANYKMPNEKPLNDEEGWVIVQDQMRRTLKVPNTGMAVLNDIGEAKDIHPKNKLDVGKRLSLWAFKQAYAKKMVCSGPLYKTSKIKSNKILITFSHVGSGLMVGKKDLMAPTVEVDEPLKRFQICGEDGQWKWANAKIIAKNKVEVWHRDIQHPVEVRYAWSPNPKGANLYNKEGLPTSVFKTKD